MRCMWKSFSAAAPTVGICTLKAQQCQIKELNIQKHPLEDTGGGRRRRAGGGVIGRRLARAPLLTALPFRSFPRALVPAAPPRLWRSACDYDVSATRAFGSGSRSAILKKRKKALEVGRSVADSSRQVQLYIIITQAGLRTSAPPYYVT